MQLLMEHSQKGKVFRLWITYELSEPELSLVERYNIRQVILVEGNRQAEWTGRARWQGRLPSLCTSPVSFGPSAKAATTFRRF
jgi:hypothetical protein